MHAYSLVWLKSDRIRFLIVGLKHLIYSIDSRITPACICSIRLDSDFTFCAGSILFSHMLFLTPWNYECACVCACACVWHGRFSGWWAERPQSKHKERITQFIQQLKDSFDTKFITKNTYYFYKVTESIKLNRYFKLFLHFEADLVYLHVRISVTVPCGFACFSFSTPPLLDDHFASHASVFFPLF